MTEEISTWQYIKVVSRLVHLIGSTYMIGQAYNIYNLVNPADTATYSKNAKVLWPVISVAMFVAGFSLMIALIKIRRPGPKYSTWKHLLYLKVCLFVLCTPITDKFLIKDWESSQVFKFWVLILLLFVSVFTRFYREDITGGFKPVDGEGINEALRKDEQDDS